MQDIPLPEIRKVADETAKELQYSFSTEFDNSSRVAIHRDYLPNQIAGLCYTSESLVGKNELPYYCDEFRVVFFRPTNVKVIPQTIEIEADTMYFQETDQVADFLEREVESRYHIAGLSESNVPEIFFYGLEDNAMFGISLGRIYDHCDPRIVLRDAIKATVFAAQDFGMAAYKHKKQLDDLLPKARKFQEEIVPEDPLKLSTLPL